MTNPTAADTLNSATVPHADQHANANDAIEAIEATLGVNPQGGSATVVARLNALDTTVAGKETPAGAQAKADAAQTAATAAAASDATSKVSAHAAVTTSVHGIADTAALVLTSDSRLSNSRTPTAHASSHGAAGSDPITITSSQVSGLAVSATTDTTNAANITSGTLSNNRLSGVALLASSNTFTGGIQTVKASGVQGMSIETSRYPSLRFYNAAGTSATVLGTDPETGAAALYTSRALGSGEFYIATEINENIPKWRLTTTQIQHNLPTSFTPSSGVPVTVDAIAGNDIQRWATANQTYAAMAELGRLWIRSNGIINGASLSVATGYDSAIGSIIRGNSITQSADLSQWTKYDNTLLARVASNGLFETTAGIKATGNYSNSFGGQEVSNVIVTVNPLASNIGLLVRGATSQSGDLQRWTQQDLTVLAKVDKDGKVTTPGVTVSGFTAAGIVHNDSSGVLSTSLIGTADLASTLYGVVGSIQALGSVAAGTSATVARADHVHPTTGLAVLDSSNTFTGATQMVKASGVQGMSIETSRYPALRFYNAAGATATVFGTDPETGAAVLYTSRALGSGTFFIATEIAENIPKWSVSPTQITHSLPTVFQGNNTVVIDADNKAGISINRNSATQSTNLFQLFQSNGSTVLASFGPQGNLAIRNDNGAAGTVPLKVTAHATQSVDVFQLVTSAGANLAKVSSAGKLTTIIDGGSA